MFCWFDADMLTGRCVLACGSVIRVCKRLVVAPPNSDDDGVLQLNAVVDEGVATKAEGIMVTKFLIPCFGIPFANELSGLETHSLRV